MENLSPDTPSPRKGPSSRNLPKREKIPHACIDLGFLRLRADDDQWILEKQSGKGWKNEGYFTKLEVVYQAILELRLRRAPISTLEELVAKVKKQRAEVKKLLQTQEP